MIQYKNWSNESEWLPGRDEEPLHIFRSNERGMLLLPEGQPDLVKPDYERKHKLDLVKSNIESLRMYLSYGQFQWWQSLFEDPGQILTNKQEWYGRYGSVDQ